MLVVPTIGAATGSLVINQANATWVMEISFLLAISSTLRRTTVNEAISTNIESSSPIDDHIIGIISLL
jgi:hypothetical protein